jgi:hypothetical protein
MLKATGLSTFASNGTTAATSITLNCSTTAGGGATGTLVVKSSATLATGSQIIVSAYSTAASAGLATGTVNTLTGAGAANFTITPPVGAGGQTLTPTNTSITYTISLAATPSIGCQGLNPAQTPTFYFNYIAGTTATPGSTFVAGPQMTVNSTVDGGGSVASALTVAPSGTVALTCYEVFNAAGVGHYYPGPAVQITVNSTAAGGTPFGIDSSPSVASWVSYPVALASTPVAPVSGSTAQFSIQAAAGCNGLAIGATALTTAINLQSTLLTSSGATVADKVINVTLTVLAGSASALTASIPTVNLTCTLVGLSTWIPNATVYSESISSTPSTAFTVDTSLASVPTWLELNGGTAFTGGTSVGGTPVVFGIQTKAGCGGLPVSSTPVTYTIYLQSTGVSQNEQAIVVNIRVSGPGASPLVVIPSPITVTCAKIPNGSGGYNYVPNFPQTVSVTSSTPTTFTVTALSAPYSNWLSIGPLSPLSGAASTSAVTFTLQAIGTSGGQSCNGGVASTVSVHLASLGNNDAQFSVNLAIVNGTPLTATPASASITYVKGSGTAGFADVALGTSLLSPYFTVNDASLPAWLRVSPETGSAPQSIRFSSTNVADTMAPGTWGPANVVVNVSGYGDLTIPVTMLLTNKAAQMTVQGSTTVNLTWIEGSAYPTPTITVLSTDTPIAYVATTGGSLAPVIPAAQQNGLAYSFGTPINVSFSSQAFATASPGSNLTGTVTLTWGNPASTIVVTFDVLVQAPGATITALSPSTEAFGQSTFNVALTGTGFVQGVALTQATTVGIVTVAGSPMTFDTAINPTIINGSNMSLQFIYPGLGYTGQIPFTSALATSLGKTSVVIGVCNPVGGVPCTIATASQTLNFGSNPIVQAVVSSSSLLQTGSVPALAPFDMISIFGSNFCPYCATSGANSILTGAPDPLTLTYPKSLAFTPTTAQAALTPPVVAGTLTVTFQHDTNGSALVTTPAPILFATNGQINLMVPSTDPTGQVAVPTGLVDIVVTYTPAGGSPGSSIIFPVTIQATDPGIFTVGADGQGSGAILDLNGNLISAANPSGLRNATVSGNSDIVSIYMTGLGAPDSSASNASAGVDNGGGGLKWSTDCVDTGTYLTSFNQQQTGTAINSLDGTLIMTGPLNSGRLVPCLLSGGTDAVSLTVGNQSVTGASILYAGWTPDTIAGLYQVTFRLPDNIANGFTLENGSLLQSITAATQVPVYVTSDGHTTQSGVSIWVAPRLLVTGPSTGGGTIPNTMSVKVGTPLPNVYAAANAVAATGGPNGATNVNYTYAVTSGLLPPGLSIIPSGTYGGQIIGTPAASTGNPGSNSYTVTVTATDQETIPVTGTVTFVVTVGDGLFMTDTAPTASTFGTANAAVTTVTATGGVAPYYYTLPNDYTTTTGITIGSTNPTILNTVGLIGTSATTKAGTYNLAVSATDSGGTPLSTTTFPITVGLDVGPAVVTAATHAGWTTSVAYNTMPVLGGVGSSPTYTFALDAVSAAFVAQNSAWLSFDSTTGILTITAAPNVTGSFSVTETVTDNAAPAGDVVAAGTGTAAPFTFVIN